MDFRPPTLNDLTAAERPHQAERAHLPHEMREVGKTAVSAAQAAEQKTRNKESHRKQLEDLIKQEAVQVAGNLRARGVRPDVKLGTHDFKAPNRTLKARHVRGLSGMREAYRSKLGESKGSLSGWILTPPQEVGSANRPGGTSQTASNPSKNRTGFALGTNGKIYKYYVKQPIRRPNDDGPMTLFVNNEPFDLVRPDQVMQHRDGHVIGYEDRIAPHYGHPDAGYVPRAGEDDHSIIHGLGIRQALAALNARAAPRPRP